MGLIPKQTVFKLQKLATSILFLTAVLHVLCMIPFGVSLTTIPVALYGLVYFVLAVLLTNNHPQAILLAVALPLIGLIAFFTVVGTSFFPWWFNTFFILVDLFVIGVFAYSLIIGKGDQLSED